MMFIAGVLLGAIACSKEEEEATPAGTPTVQGTGSEEAPVKGSYLIGRFEQDGVENPEMFEQKLTLTKDHVVKVNGRNYELTGQWSYDSTKGYLSINVPGDQFQAKAVTADTWQVVSSTAEQVVLKADLGQTSKKMELKVDRSVQ